MPTKEFGPIACWLICSMSLLGLSLVTLMSRNDTYEYCTTKAYGYPFPWYIDHCLCEREASNLPVGNWAWNGAIALVLGAILGFAVHALFRGSASSAGDDDRPSS